MEEYTIERFMDKIVFSDTEKIKKDYPYHAFPIIAIGIEIIGRLACDEEFDKSGVSGELFYKAIQTCPSLGAYKKYNADKNINLLYKGLRCSMLHSFIPDGFRLAPGKNDFSKDEIGCEEHLSPQKLAENDKKGNETKVPLYQSLTRIFCFSDF